jgi:hypothetical protein
MNDKKRGFDLEASENPDWIPGIYNYCDRWCERCAFTSRCRSFSMEKRSLEQSEEEDELPGQGTKEHDIRSKEFWDDLGEIMNQTIEYLRSVSAEPGAEALAMNDQQWEDLKKRDEEIEVQAREHPVAIAAWKYSDLTERWMAQNTDLVNEKYSELETRIKLDAGKKRAASEADLIRDAQEIIRWYEPQIWVKLMRALTGKMTEEKEEGKDAFPLDSDGSAKVSLIGIDRSLAAWGQLQFIFPEQTNDFITILLQLDRLRRQVESEFPHARAFRRAGFDDEEKIQA